jgi:Undecaprenyl-phosphate glucose phosphotransferase
MRNDFLSPEIVSSVVKTADFAVIVFTSFAAYVFYVEIYLADYHDLFRYVATSVLSAFLFVIIYQQIGSYRLAQLSLLSRQLSLVVLAWCGSIAILMVLAFITKASATYSRGWATIWIAGAAACLAISRCIFSLAIARWTHAGLFLRNVAVVGAGEVGKQFIEKLRDTRDSGTRIVGVFDDRRSRVLPLGEGIDLLGTTDDLLKFARTTQIDEIIVALPLNADQRLRVLFQKLKSVPADLRLSIEPLAGRIPVRGIDQIIDVPLLQIVDRPLKKWNGVMKKCEDMILASLLLVVFAPTMALIALIIKLSPGPIFFIQDRFGYNNMPIRVLKFRTMYWDKCDRAGGQRTLQNDPRVTRFGRFLRSLSLDELPQLINVLKGEMSLVGPRAHPIAMMAGDRLYHEAVDSYLHRHRVKPGITGWAQIKGLRGEINTLERARLRVAHDLEYIEHWSLWLDVKILFITALTVFRRENAY